MRRRAWRIEWRVRPQADGLERLGQAVRLLIDRAGAAGPSGSLGGATEEAKREDRAEGEQT